MDSCISTDCWIASNGIVSCKNPCEHSGFCGNNDFTTWPFDDQVCAHLYVSRTRTTDEIVFNSSLSYITEKDIESDDWTLGTITVTNGSDNQLLDDRNTSHPYVLLDLMIYRNNLEHVHQVIIPTFIVIIFNLLLLLMNPSAPERVVLLIINLFSHGVYIEQLSFM